MHVALREPRSEHDHGLDHRRRVPARQRRRTGRDARRTVLVRRGVFVVVVLRVNDGPEDAQRADEREQCSGQQESIPHQVNQSRRRLSVKDLC
jgi:hypothetical protein